MIEKEDGKKFLTLARETITLAFDRKKPSLDPVLQKKYSQKQGCFVTLHKDSQLRGCIGYPEPYLPLLDAIESAATMAAFEDPRFPPLEKKELKQIEIEVSILTIPKQITVNKPEDVIQKIVIGRHGLILRGIFGSGLLLPQVATEWKMTKEEFLEALSQKAGLHPDAWKDPSNKILSFEAEIFSEEHHVIRRTQ